MSSPPSPGSSRFPGDEHRDFLSRIAVYVFAWYFLAPVAIGIALPALARLSEEPFDALLPRLASLIATGGASFVVAFLPALLLRRPGLLRGVYEFLLFPVFVVCTVAQLILYFEFGAEINERLLGLFQGNITALWAFAREQYGIHWAIAATLAVSVGLFLWLRSCRRPLWRPSAPVTLAASFGVAAAAAVTIGLDHDLDRIDAYHPAKLSGAPVYQALVFAGEQAFAERASGVRNILRKTAELRHESERTELSNRLGEQPESFLRETAAPPPWLERRPSHVFLFIMESMDYAFLSEPTLAPVAPRLRQFAREGISVPYFYAPSGSTIDAIQASLSGATSQLRYPDARVLERMKVDSLPRLMERAGYQSAFYAASHGRFGNKGASCEAHGYDEFVGLPDHLPELANNEWGVHDGPFFDWTHTQLEGADEPRFVTFLNVSYHSPYDVPAAELEEADALGREVLDRFHGRTPGERRRYAAHARYADREVGEMVDWLAERYPDALFCLVSDHCGIKLREGSGRRVPFILWGDSVIDASVDASKWFGSHMDIPATLASLVLPGEETFLTLGEPCWSLSEERVSLAGDSLLCESGLWSRKGKLLEPFDPAGRSRSTPGFSRRALLKASAIESLSWGLTYEKAAFLSLGEARTTASAPESRGEATLSARREADPPTATTAAHTRSRKTER